MTNGDRIPHLLDTLAEHYNMGDLTKWEEEFYESVAGQFEMNNSLSDLQVEKMEEIVKGVLERR